MLSKRLPTKAIIVPANAKSAGRHSKANRAVQRAALRLIPLRGGK